MKRDISSEEGNEGVPLNSSEEVERELARDETPEPLALTFNQKVKQEGRERK